jgi:hypothetical protein
MLSRILPYLLAASALLLALSEHQRAEAISVLLSGSQSQVRRLSEDSLALKASVDRQNAAVTGLKSRLSSEALQAAGRATQKLATLPAKLATDHQSSTQPEEMNKWLDSLFSY